MEDKINAIIRRLSKLERDAKEARKTSDARKLFLIETESHILAFYLDHLELIRIDPSSTEEDYKNLKVNPELLKKITPDIRLSVMCLTEGICGVEDNN